jgi:ribonuclease Z
LSSGNLEGTWLEVVFLGTAGSTPTARRSSPAIAIRRGSELILLDCGEGMQRQMVLAGIGMKSKMRILITHMHGDHVLGLPGLIQTMALFDREAPLQVYGPEGVFAFIKAMKETVKFGLTFPIEVKEVQAGIVYDERDYHVESAWTSHLVPTLAYALVENFRLGRFEPEKAKVLDIPEGPLWGLLQHGKAVTAPNGQTVYPELVVGQPRPGRRVVYSGDTGPCESILELAKGADILIHESTFADSLAEKASQMGHSTPSQAADVAKKAGALRLVLTHISGRYDEDEGFLEGSKRVFPGVLLAEDFMVLKVPLRD